MVKNNESRLREQLSLKKKSSAMPKLAIKENFSLNSGRRIQATN
jgi:hypothetical protein